MTLALPVEHVSMNVLLMQYQRVIFIQSILRFAPIVVLVQMSARQNPSIRHKNGYKTEKAGHLCLAFFVLY